MVAPSKNREVAAAVKGPLAARIEEEHGRIITERQKTFAELYVEGLYTNAECARRAGFSHDIAHVYAVKLLNGNDFPHVVEYIKELREAKERKYGVTTIGQLERLYHLSRGAEEAKQFSAAINAEKLRSALGGLTTDRRETLNRIENMSRDQILDRLMELQQKYPFLRDVTPKASEGEDNGAGSQALEGPEASS
ncbi:Terminase small subunit [uncultured Caudovirales phage]|uniref:Terminase small subunit n=1 Tax=uncultured Caudovirales phage TaxID=2100421 RepID=A0A6J5LWP2_9CAUD|nr:Terminase small subunit [uncultured Caudovirales phage]